MQPPSTSSPVDNPSDRPRRELLIKPLGCKWRSSYGFVTFVVWLGTFGLNLFFRPNNLHSKPGIATDLLVYAMVIPIVPFQLEKPGYKHPASLTGWLLFAYVRFILASLFCSI